MKISEVLSENFQFLVVKFSTYLNRRVFVIGILMAKTIQLKIYALNDILENLQTHCQINVIFYHENI